MGLDKKRNLIVDGFMSINQFCTFQNHNIRSETNNYTDDGHPGYFGHIEYAKLLKNFLDEKLTPSKIILNKKII